MMNLSETERAALMLRHFEGHSIKEIANILESDHKRLQTGRISRGEKKCASN